MTESPTPRFEPRIEDQSRSNTVDANDRWDYILASMGQAPMSQSRAEMSEVAGSNITQRGLHVKSLSGEIMELLVVQLDVTSAIPGVCLVDPDLDGEKCISRMDERYLEPIPAGTNAGIKQRSVSARSEIKESRGMKGVGEDNCSATMKSGRKVKTGRLRVFGTLLSSGKTGNTAPGFRVAINDWC